MSSPKPSEPSNSNDTPKLTKLVNLDRKPTSAKILSSQEQDTKDSSSVVNQSPSALRSFATCALYGCISVSITFFNKAVFSVYGFRFPCFLTLLQITLCISLLVIANLFRLIKLPSINLYLITVVYPLTFCWWIYVVSGIAALRYLNIPMFATLRKSTALIVLTLETSILRKKSSSAIWASILVMVFGGLLAGITDLSFNLIGYILVTLCCFSTAFYLVLIVQTTNRSKLDTFGLLFYNNILSFPLMLGYMLLFTNELAEVTNYEYIRDIKFWTFLLFSAAQATVLNFAIFMCTKLNSPLATTVTGQMKDFVTIGFGLFLFGDVQLNLPNLIGLGISLFGSLMYSRIKLIAVIGKQGESVLKKKNEQYQQEK